MKNVWFGINHRMTERLNWVEISWAGFSQAFSATELENKFKCFNDDKFHSRYVDPSFEDQEENF